MFETVTLDPEVLVLPNAESTHAEVQGYIENLVEWSALLEEPWMTLLVSDRSAGALLEDGVYPFWKTLEEFFTAHGVVEYSVGDVVHVLDRFLSMAPSFEEHHGVQDVLFDMDDVVTEPDVLHGELGENVRWARARCFLLLAVLDRYCEESTGLNVVALRRAPDAAVVLRARLVDLEHDRQDLAAVAAVEELRAAVMVCDGVLGLLWSVDEGELLRGAREQNEVGLACRIALLKARRRAGEEVAWAQVMDWRMGGRFADAVWRCCRDTGGGFAGKLLRAVVETVQGENLQATHWLRTGSGGNDPQRRRKRDGAAAWRRSIDDEYRLHYWMLSDGRVELSWVCAHNDFSIPE